MKVQFDGNWEAKGQTNYAELATDGRGFENGEVVKVAHHSSLVGDDEMTEATKERAESLVQIIPILLNSMRLVQPVHYLIWPVFRDCFARFDSLQDAAERLRIGYPKCLEVATTLCSQINKHGIFTDRDESKVMPVFEKFVSKFNSNFETKEDHMQVCWAINGKLIEGRTVTDICRQGGGNRRQIHRITSRLKKSLPEVFR